MTKLKFLLSLHEKLSALPQKEVEERLRFYSEMIEDRMEEGIPEDDAVAAVGSVEEIAAQITADLLSAKTEKKIMKPKKRSKAWEITLLILGSPIWVSLLITAFAVILSLYVSVWAVILAFWAVFVSLVAVVLCGVALGIGFSVSGKLFAGLAILGAMCVCTGLAILLFLCCKAVTRGTWLLTKKMVLGIKKGFAKRGEEA